VIQAFNRGGFLDTATSNFLTLLARFVYGVDRNQAQAADGEITLTNTTATPHPIAVGELTVAHATSGKTYRNTEAGTLAALGTITLDILADEVGAASDASPNTITVLVSTLLGVTCTNAASVLGADEENDSDLAERCRDKLAALSPNGAAAAYEYLAKSTSVLVNRVAVAANSSTGDVVVTLASPSGIVQPADVAIVNAAIQTQVVPLCITATVQSATALTIPVTCTVWVYTDANLTNAQVQALVSLQLSRYFASLKIGGDIVPPAGGKVFVDAIRGEIRQASSAIFHATIAAPSSDVSIATTQVAVLGAVTTSVIQVVRT
jgi:phage-related baseplate assembly protein